jgi:hypothetical protein
MDQVIDWLNENENRAYPLLEDVDKRCITEGVDWSFPDEIIIDANLVFLTQDLSSLSPALNRIRIDGNKVVFEISAGNEHQEFSIDDALAENYPHYVRLSNGSLLVVGEAVKQIPFYGGTLDLDFAIPFEPAVTTQFNEAWLGVSSIQGNPEKKTNPGTYSPELYLKAALEPTKLSGDVYFLEGYNFRVDIADNLIDLEIGFNYGLLMNCETGFLDPVYLDCSDLVSYVNGIPPDADGNLRILPGSNIDIILGTSVGSGVFNDKFGERAEDHTLLVGMTFSTTDICAPVDIKPNI